MDKETRHELDRLFQAFQAAMDEIRNAAGEDRELMGWKKVQTAAWELHELLPSAERRSS